MKKLDNRGFAITGILYTVLIMFLMILLNILGTLRASRAMMIRSLVGTENFFTGKEVDNTILEQAKLNKIAPVTGKYVFELTYETENESHVRVTKKFECSSYLMKNTKLLSEGGNRIIYTPKDCNDYNYQFTFNEVSGVNKMELKKIYQFGSDDE